MLTRALREEISDGPIEGQATALDLVGRPVQHDVEDRDEPFDGQVAANDPVAPRGGSSRDHYDANPD